MVLKVILISFVFIVYSCGNEIKQVKTEEYLPASGSELYDMHCISCHGANGALGSGAAANLMVSKLEDKAIKKMILYGNENGMMPYKDLLANDSEADSLVSYVKTLRK